MPGGNLNHHLLAAVSVDIDTLASIYKGHGCRRPGGYTYIELRMGLENLIHFLEPYRIRATLFMVGNDFRYQQNHEIIRAMANAGHEIANHSLSHIQGFRFLPPSEKETEIAGMEELCGHITGKRPVGFRSPGWNIADDALPILQKRGYLYDSSVFPTSLTPLLKFLYWYTMRGNPTKDRTTLGNWKYIIAPVTPYQTGKQDFVHKGQSRFWELPVTVTPGLRIPFSATFLLSTGLKFFWFCFRTLKSCQRPIHFQFHLSDFVDYSHPDLGDQMPMGNGTYVPEALRIPLERKEKLFRRGLDIMAAHYQFITLEQWARELSQNDPHNSSEFSALEDGR
jgi:hypothetical protein